VAQAVEQLSRKYKAPSSNSGCTKRRKKKRYIMLTSKIVKHPIFNDTFPQWELIIYDNKTLLVTFQR
jgi:hypothetical protein